MSTNEADLIAKLAKEAFGKLSTGSLEASAFNPHTLETGAHLPTGASLPGIPSIPPNFGGGFNPHSLVPGGSLPSHLNAIPTPAIPSTPTIPGGLNPLGLVPGSGLPTSVSGFSNPSLPGAPPLPSIPKELNFHSVELPDFANFDKFAFDSSLVPSHIPVSSGARGLGNVRKDFPILDQKVNGRRLVWLDNAATTQKPRAVINRLVEFYETENSNIHRGAHELAARATDAYEEARKKTAQFLGASSSDEIVFVRGATEAINLVARTYGAQNVQRGDEILISHLEHHANIVPWQMLCQEKGARLKVIPVDETGQIILSEYQRLLSPLTKIVSVTHVSNALGTVTPVNEIVRLAHMVGARVLIDGAQSVSHMAINVQSIGCDFFVFSGHKVFAPTGIGVLFGKQSILETMIPWQGGGNMIQDVTFEKTIFQPSPFRFEAGTGNIADAVGLGAAIDYLNAIGMDVIAKHEHDLIEYATQELRKIPGLHIIGTAPDKAGVVSFVLEGFTPESIGKALNLEGIAVRSGHHCAQPILRRFGHEATVRPSFALYNTCEDVDLLIHAILNLKQGRVPGPV